MINQNVPKYNNKLTNKLYWLTVLAITLVGLIIICVRLSFDYSYIKEELQQYAKTTAQNTPALAGFIKERKYEDLDNFLGVIIQQKGISYIQVETIDGRNFEKGVRLNDSSQDIVFPLNIEGTNTELGTLTLQLDTSYSVQEFVRLIFGYLLMAAVSSVFIFVFIRYLLTHLVERHIDKVIKYLQSLPNAKTPLALDRTRQEDELDLLCDEINHFTREIQHTSNLLEFQNNSLELQVQERTKELLEKNASLEGAMTKITRMQSTLIAHEKLASLGTLVSSIAHEIRNPLNFVINFSELLEESEDMADIKNISRVIQKHSQRIDQIVRSMQILIGENNEALELGSIPFIIQKSYHQALSMRMISEKFTPPKVTFKIHEHVKIPVFQESLTRALTNIIDNAMYALEKKQSIESNFKPEIIISTKRRDDTLSIVVMDNGTGIPALLGDKVYDPFLTTKTTGEGSGLGLTVAYNVIQKHGGTIDYSSEFGKWTEFIIEIPLEENWDN